MVLADDPSSRPPPPHPSPPSSLCLYNLCAFCSFYRPRALPLLPLVLCGPPPHVERNSSGLRAAEWWIVPPVCMPPLWSRRGSFLVTVHANKWYLTILITHLPIHSMFRLFVFFLCQNIVLPPLSLSYAPLRDESLLSQSQFIAFTQVCCARTLKIQFFTFLWVFFFFIVIHFSAFTLLWTEWLRALLWPFLQ